MAENNRPQIKVKPQNGFLLLAPIKDPGEKTLIEIAGRSMPMVPACVEAVSAEGRIKDIQVGDVVYFISEIVQSVALDLGMVYVTIHENDVRLLLKAADAGEINFQDTTPQGIKKDIAEASAKKAGRAQLVEDAKLGKQIVDAGGVEIIQ